MTDAEMAILQRAVALRRAAIDLLAWVDEMDEDEWLEVPELQKRLLAFRALVS